MGAIAIIISGFFLVKYSLENNIFGPSARLLLAWLLGGGLIAGGEIFMRKSIAGNKDNITQALVGSGIAILYGATYSAAEIYSFIPHEAAFFIICVITSFAAISSIRYGYGVAMLSLVGAFAAPAMVDITSRSGLYLFVYIYIVILGLLYLARRQNWWSIVAVSTVGYLIWLSVGLFSASQILTPTFAIFSFIIVSFTYALFIGDYKSTPESQIEASYSFKEFSNYVAIGGGLILLLSSHVIYHTTLFGLLMQSVIATGVILLAYINHKQYNYLTWLSLASACILFIIYKTNSSAEIIYIGSLFWLVFGLLTYFLSFISRNRVFPILCYASSLALNFILYNKLVTLGISSSYWGIFTLGLAAFFAASIFLALARIISWPTRYYVAGYFATASSGLLSISLMVLLPKEFTAVALALQILALAIINKEYPIANLRFVSGLTLLVSLVFFVLSLAPSNHAGFVKIFRLFLNTLHYNLAPFVFLPSMILFIASLAFYSHRDGRLVKILQSSSIVSLIIGGFSSYNFWASFLRDYTETYQRIAEALIANYLLLVSMALYVTASYLGPKRLYKWAGGTLIIGVGYCCLYTIIFPFDVPLSKFGIEGVTFFNSALLNYFVPPVIILTIVHFYGRQFKAAASGALGGFSLVLLLLLLRANIAIYYHGTGGLSYAFTTQAEIYSLSVVWLLFGIALLVAGARWANRSLRLASLAVMLLVVCKVFLFDAAHLQDLYRVFTFLGLGLSLIALSWFYSRFVFAGGSRTSK